MAQRITLNNIDPSALTAIGGPKIASIEYPGNDTAASTNGGQTITLIGAGFQTGAGVYVDSTIVGVVTVISDTVLNFSTPAKTAGGYPLYVVNPDGGTATFIPGIQYSGTPTWITNSGNLGTVYETQAVSAGLSAVSDSAVSYSLTSGALPVGVSLSGNTISGNAGSVSGNTTYNFTIDAVDAELQNTSRSFNIAVLADTVTWTTPSNNTTLVANTGESVTQTLSASSASGAAVAYSANALPSGITLTANVISGSSNTAANTTTLLTATSLSSGKTATRVVNFQINSTIIPPGQAQYTSAGTYSWTAPAGVTSVCVVCVGGGGGSSRQGNGVGGSGGGLGWKNNISVVPGQSYTVVVGAGGLKGVSISVPGNNGGTSYFISTATVAGYGGAGGNNSFTDSGNFVGDGGGIGGFGAGGASSTIGGGAGGAGGYTGPGGGGATGANGSAGSGGGGGGGAGRTVSSLAGGGGGVGIFGQGANGAGGLSSSATGMGGGGGSGGSNGGSQNDGNGGEFGGGGAFNTNGHGAGGAVRIIWGTGRAFPATNTANM